MLNFLKGLFGGKSEEGTTKSSGCCGGSSCCGGETKTVAPVDLGISDNDLSKLGLIDERVVVGKIISIRPHKSEKMTKVKVTECDLGNGQTEQILCGGANIAEGQIVPVATIGSDLGGGFVIGEREIRGEVSRGMICARQEIGLTEVETEKGGIWIMPESLESKLGTPVSYWG